MAQPTNLRPTCYRPRAYTTFRFRLSRWPCRGNRGYFVQKVRVHCHVAKCSPPALSSDSGETDHFSYFEAWPIVRPARGGTLEVFDRAENRTAGQGRYRQDGTVKFYCLSPDNEVRPGEIGLNETSNPGPREFGRGGPCPTRSGALHASDFEPYWVRDGAAGTGNRTFGMNWNCCCESSLRFANAFARP
jgi:hypothetical protein